MKNKIFIKKYLRDTIKIAKVISIDKIDRVIDILFEAWKNENTIYVMGNGGSGSTASHFVCELLKNTVVPTKKRFKIMGLTDNTPLLISLINDISFDAIYVEQLIPFVKKGDVVIGISVHGASGKGLRRAWSQNILRAMVLAKKRGATTVAFSGFDGGKLKEICNISVIVPFNRIPNVEDFHLILSHLISSCLKQKIEKVPNDNISQ